jgi:hypothetical protein
MKVVMSSMDFRIRKDCQIAVGLGFKALHEQQAKVS